MLRHFSDMFRKLKANDKGSKHYPYILFTAHGMVWNITLAERVASWSTAAMRRCKFENHVNHHNTRSWRSELSKVRFFLENLLNFMGFHGKSKRIDDDMYCIPKNDTERMKHHNTSRLLNTCTEYFHAFPYSWAIVATLPYKTSWEQKYNKLKNTRTAPIRTI